LDVVDEASEAEARALDEAVAFINLDLTTGFVRGLLEGSLLTAMVNETRRGTLKI
jgi:hypothetical protein